LVLDVLHRLPHAGAGASLKLIIENKLVAHKQYINKYGQDMPEILNWKWDLAEASKPE